MRFSLELLHHHCELAREVSHGRKIWDEVEDFASWHWIGSRNIRAEAILKKAGINVRLVPTPRELSSDCGVALRFSWEEVTKVTAMLEAVKVVAVGVFEAPK